MSKQCQCGKEVCKYPLCHANMADAKSDDRHTKVADIMPKEWDRKPFSLAGELRTYLKTIRDEGTHIDSGGGDGSADLWVTVQGVEYYINVRQSNANKAKHADTSK